MQTAKSRLGVIVLAAGQGKRMNSARAKVLHEVAGRPLLDYPLAAAEALGPEKLVVVIGRDAEQVEATFATRATFVLQAEQRGTGHAVLQARSHFEGFDGDLLILYGDTPLLRAGSLRALAERKRATGSDLALLSARVDVPGIVLRGADGRLARIVEATDATPEQLRIEERNTGVYLVSAPALWSSLAQVRDDNRQGEVYLTSIVEILLAQGRRCEALALEDDSEGLGVNDRVDLARAAQALYQRKRVDVMRAGVTLLDPASTFIDSAVEIGRDTLIEPNCSLQGATRIGESCHLKAGCVIEASVVGNDVVLGPMAHLRPGCVLGDRVRIGNFVEVKNSRLADDVKADHLSYIGDAEIGEGASFGCGSITVNYNWTSKERTVVEAGAVIGCNANLVAPVRIGRNASVAAGSTITKPVPDEALAVERSRQDHVEGWSRRKRPADKLR